MEQRLDALQIDPDGYKAVLRLEQLNRERVPHDLLELVKLRASMLNGCAFCVDMHSTDAMQAGEDPRRLYAVSVWRESPWFTAAERAALDLTDAVTRLGEHGVPDDVWEAAVKEHGEDGTTHLLLAIATINVWNRLSVATRKAPPPLTEAS
jgi:AhpD family alkylhydroperoxidase